MIERITHVTRTIVGSTSNGLPLRLGHWSEIDRTAPVFELAEPVGRPERGDPPQIELVQSRQLSQFISILGVAFVYAWRKGVLDWKN